MLIVTGLVGKRLDIRDEVILNGMEWQGQVGPIGHHEESKLYSKYNGNPLGIFN